MKNYLKFAPLLLVIFIFGCSKDEAPDPRQIFVGAFEMEDYNTLVTFGTDDSLFSVSANSDIEFLQREGLHADELVINIEDFTNEVIQKTLGEIAVSTIFTIDFEEDVLTEISSDEFELYFYFPLMISDGGTTQELICKFEGDGEINGDEIEIEYEITLYAGVGANYVFSGTAVGTRD